MRLAVTIVVVALLLVIGLWLSWNVFVALKSGEAHAAGGRKHQKKKRPLMYWMAILAGVLCFLVYLCGCSLGRAAFEMRQGSAATLGGWRCLPISGDARG